MEKLNFGKQLIKIREARGLTQAEVGEKCNITTRTIQRIESGSVKPRASTIKIISKNLEVDFFETSNQNSKFKNHTILWQLKDLFNFKTNTVKKISILSTLALFIVFICINIINAKAQSNNTKKQEKAIPNTKYQKVNISDEYLKVAINGNYVITSKNNKYGVMNLDGKVIIPCEYDKLQIEGNYFVAIKNSKIGVMNLNGKVIIPCEYEKLQIEGNYFAAIKNNKIGVMNLNGKVIIPCEYDEVNIKSGYALVTKNGKTKRIPI